LNPWQGQSLPKASKRREDGEKDKRPYTDAEIVTLLDGNPDPEISDLVRVAALSGMRLEEIYRLTVRDCTDGLFRIRKSKTPAGVRDVPIHSGVAAIVARRTEGKGPTEFLFHEAGTPKGVRERSSVVSQRFMRYRLRLGVEDREDGRRHSRIDFHSFRRWFISRARQAGFERAIVAQVVGHEAGNITDDVYSEGATLAQKRACVEAVQLPSA
jgi:integrase